MRRAAKVDANAAELIELARKLGMQVEIVKEPVDAFVAIGGKWFALELKNPKGRNKFTDQQLDFIDRCAISGAPMLTWRTCEDVMACYEGSHSLKYEAREG